MLTLEFFDWFLQCPKDPYIEIVTRIDGVLVGFSWLSPEVTDMIFVRICGVSSTSFSAGSIKKDAPDWIVREINLYYNQPQDDY